MTCAIININGLYHVRIPLLLMLVFTPHSDTNNNFSIQNFDQNKSRSVADFISGMTDRYAINLYEELK